MKELLFLILLFYTTNIFSQNLGEWTWMKGSDSTNYSGNFGVKGVPSINNNPPALYEACSWTDTSGNFWLFGGSFDNGTNEKGTFNTLWKFNPLTNIWIWMNGTNNLNDVGDYGVQGIPSSTNCPSARGYGIMSWTDKNNNLWLFAGSGVNFYNQDLWKYDISTNEWTWISGLNAGVGFGIYGIKGIASVNNFPPHIEENNCTWVDKKNLLWFFGGLNRDSNNIFSTKFLNDLWNYNPSTNEWTWVYGNATPNISTFYGIKGVANINNNPGGRCSYASFMDKDDNLYFFGSGNDFFSSFPHTTNDIWKYSIKTQLWTWLSGDSYFNSDGYYDIPCISDSNRIPKSRYEVRSSWTDSCGFWIYGGFTENTKTLSDFWRYDYFNNNWTRISGYTTLNDYPNHGTYQVSSIWNSPGGRGGAVSWMDKKSGSLWMFGGFTIHPIYYYRGDLWRFVPDSNCVQLCLTSNHPPLPEPLPDTLQPKIIIPNIFTPNGDGFNDQFKIIAENYESYHLQVYNRWGSLVFESKESSNIWNGEINNHGSICSDGVYFFILNLTDFHQISTLHKGTVTLMRNK